MTWLHVEQRLCARRAIWPCSCSSSATGGRRWMLKIHIRWNITTDKTAMSVIRMDASTKNSRINKISPSCVGVRSRGGGLGLSQSSGRCSSACLQETQFEHRITRIQFLGGTALFTYLTRSWSQRRYTLEIDWKRSGITPPTQSAWRRNRRVLACRTWPWLDSCSNSLYQVFFVAIRISNLRRWGEERSTKTSDIAPIF